MMPSALIVTMRASPRPPTARPPRHLRPHRPLKTRMRRKESGPTATGWTAWTSPPWTAPPRKSTTSMKPCVQSLRSLRCWEGLIMIFIAGFFSSPQGKRHSCCFQGRGQRSVGNLPPHGSSTTRTIPAQTRRLFTLIDYLHPCCLVSIRATSDNID